VAHTVDEANRTIDRLNGNLNALKNDGDRLFIDFKAECDCRCNVEVRLACIEGKSREVDEPMTRSSLSSAKWKVEDHLHSTRPMALPLPTTIADGLPPLKKQATKGGPINSAHDPYDPDNWEPGTYVKDYLEYGSTESLSTGLAMQGRKKGDDGLHHPEMVPLTKRNCHGSSPDSPCPSKALPLPPKA